MTAVYLVLAAVVILGGWYVHVRLFPWRTCPRCGGCLICDSHTHDPDCKGPAPYRAAKR